MEKHTLHSLELKINEMLSAYARLSEENRHLQDEKSALLKERDNLLEKNTLARTQVEAMIERLKTLETDAE